MVLRDDEEVGMEFTATILNGCFGEPYHYTDITSNSIRVGGGTSSSRSPSNDSAWSALADSAGDLPCPSLPVILLLVQGWSAFLYLARVDSGTVISARFGCPLWDFGAPCETCGEWLGSVFFSSGVLGLDKFVWTWDEGIVFGSSSPPKLLTISYYSEEVLLWFLGWRRSSDKVLRPLVVSPRTWGCFRWHSWRLVQRCIWHLIRRLVRRFGLLFRRLISRLVRHFSALFRRLIRRLDSAFQRFVWRLIRRLVRRSDSPINSEFGAWFSAWFRACFAAWFGAWFAACGSALGAWFSAFFRCLFQPLVWGLWFGAWCAVRCLFRRLVPRLNHRLALEPALGSALHAATLTSAPFISCIEYCDC